MDTTHRTLALALITAAAACGGEPTLPAIDGAPLAQVLADSGAASGIIGVQAAVIIPGHAPWTAGWGEEAPGTPMREGALLSTGGISRTFVSALVLELAQRGRLRLTDTTGKWIPSSSTIPGTITVRQLLWGQSGLYSYNNNPAFANETMSRNLAKVWAPNDLLGFVGTPVFPAGSQWGPSNSNALALSIIARKVLGHALDAEMRSRFLAPLGLAHTWFPDTLGGGPPLPIAVSWTGTPGTNFTASTLGASVHTSRWSPLGVMSTAADVARWTEALFAGGAIGAAARAQLTETVPGTSAAIPGQTDAGPGVAKFNYLGRVQFGASGTVENGSGLTVWDAQSGIVVTVLINQPQAAHGSAQYRIVPALLEAALQFSN